MSKKKRERRVLIGAMIVAGVITAGSTFAWFTSKDEVTNRLSASASYDVSIAEDFTPPENWVPGQTIDKNVGAVNTGNTDAFVRMWLEGEMRVLGQTDSTITPTAMAGLTPAAATTEPYKTANLYSVDISGTTYYLKALSNDTIQNPNTQTQNAASPNAYSEIMSVQAGGELAYVAYKSGATGNVSYTFKPNQAINVVDEDGLQYQLVKDTLYTVTVDPTAAKDIAVSGTAITIKDVSNFRTIDSNTFTPVTEGLYIFRRNKDMNATGTDAYQFSGYYFKDDVYYALENGSSNTSDYVLADGVVSYTASDAENYTVTAVNAKMFTAELTTTENSALDWKYIDANTTVTPYTNDTTGEIIYVSGGIVYDTLGDFVRGTGSTTVTGVTGYTAGTAVTYTAPCMLVAKDDIVINIALSNIGTDAENWTAKSAANKDTTFYYNNDLEEGATTAKLVDSLTLDSSVTQNDYIAFDFDLNVFMDSVQVTVAENGDEGFDSVTAWDAGANNVGATGANGTGSPVDGEITLISWT